MAQVKILDPHGEASRILWELGIQDYQAASKPGIIVPLPYLIATVPNDKLAEVKARLAEVEAKIIKAA